MYKNLFAITLACTAHFCMAQENVGVGTAAPQTRLHILGTNPGDFSYRQGVLVENNNSSSTGEAAIAFKNNGTAGSGSNSWFMGMNQNRNFSWAYGSDFFFSLTKATLDSTGALGLGTIAPNSSALLDLSSTNRALLLPRIADTANIANPAAGMVIYNQQSKSPNYFDGDNWQTMSSAQAPLFGRMTYAIITTTSVGGIAVSAGELNAFDLFNTARVNLSSGGGGSSIPQTVDSFVISKEFDGNSIVFKRAFLAGNFIAEIEIKNYQPAAVTPFYSVRLRDIVVTKQSFYISPHTGKLVETYSLSARLIGYKDWVNNKFFTYDVVTRSFTSTY